jgi:hypothetical protein
MTKWLNEERRFWEATCDGLFLLFDTSAHINGGIPNVSAREAQEHIDECDDQCAERGTSVDDYGDGTAYLND